MLPWVSTVAFEGIEARAVDVQVQVAPGLPAFAIVGLPDRAVSEANLLDLRDIKGQESAKRALKIAAAGGHHLLM
jgi:predicted ATPase with chaperone activity